MQTFGKRILAGNLCRHHVDIRMNVQPFCRKEIMSKHKITSYNPLRNEDESKLVNLRDLRLVVELLRAIKSLAFKSDKVGLISRFCPCTHMRIPRSTLT